MKRFYILFVFYLLSLVFNENIIAQTAPGFNYQALVRDSEGKVAQNTDVQFRIGIVSGDMQGPTLYQETHQVATDEYGQITLSVGNGSPVSGDFQNIDWANAPTFLKVELDLTGGTDYELMGITQLLSVPYALYAYSTDDKDPDPTNELQSWTNLPGIPENIDTDKTDDFSGQFADLLNIPQGLSDGDDIEDADADPTNELQSWTNLPGIPENIDTDKTDDFSGQFADLLNIPQGLSDGDDIEDADADPTNELQSWTNLPGIPENIDTDKTDDFSGQFADLLNIPQGLSDGDDIEDADADPTNELQVIVSAQDGNLITSGDDEGAFLGQSNLIPNLSSTERDALDNPYPGTLIFNTDQNCLNFYTPNGWRSLCGNTITPPNGDANGMLGNTFTNLLNGSGEAFSQNPACGDRLISVSGCAEVNGATIIDDPNTTGVEYYLPQTSSGLSEDYMLVEINGQCWFAENLQEDPTIYQNMPNLFTSVSDDNGWWYGFFGDNNGQSGTPSNPPADYDEREGFLYMWRAAMNGEAGERMQGACPTGWHIPSDCEWMYLEHGLGMSISNQLASGSGRTNGQVGMKLKDGGMSGFQGLYAGYVQDNSFNFLGRGSFGNFWTSTDQSGGIAVRRYIETNDMGVDRVYAGKAWAYSVRCLKD